MCIDPSWLALWVARILLEPIYPANVLMLQSHVPFSDRTLWLHSCLAAAERGWLLYFQQRLWLDLRLAAAHRG